MYIVMELQTNNGTTANIVNQYSSKSAAEQQYHAVLASAAISDVDIHTAVITDEYGNFLKREFYTHFNSSTEHSNPGQGQTIGQDSDPGVILDGHELEEEDRREV